MQKSPLESTRGRLSILIGFYLQELHLVKSRFPIEYAQYLYHQHDEQCLLNPLVKACTSLLLFQLIGHDFPEETAFYVNLQPHNSY